MKKYMITALVLLLAVLIGMICIVSCGGGGGDNDGSIFTEPAYFVSIDDPAASDSNPGTMGSPFAGIQAAIDAAAAAYSMANIYVAEGDYPVSYQSGTHIVLSEAISVYGSYAPDWSARDRDIHPSVITDTSTSGGDISDTANRAVHAESVTDVTTIDGFDINGGAGTWSHGIYVSNSSPTISGNLIDGGTGALFAMGIGIYNGSPLVTGNTIFGGMNDNFCMGIQIQYLSSPLISANLIDGGTCNGATGINQRSASTVTISANTISGGTASSEATGIYNETVSTPVIQGNIVNGGIANRTEAVMNFRTRNSLITSNTLSGGAGVFYSYGIVNENVEGPMAIRNNFINGGDGEDSTGIHNNQTAPITISGNTIDGGSGYDSIGIYSYGTSLITIEANVINGGSDTFCYGVYEIGGAANDIRNNLIYGGSGTTTYGVAIWDASPLVRNNTISGGSGSTAYGVYLTALTTISSPEIENNILIGSGSGHGVYEGTSKADPVTVGSNDIFNFSWPFYDQDSGCGGNQECSIAQMEALADMTASGNVSVDPVLMDIDGADNDPATMDDNLWTLTSSSPFSVTDGSLDLSSDFTNDYDGTTRTVPWSMGAYED